MNISDNLEEGKEEITLRRITRRNYRRIIQLKVTPNQESLIASNAVSMADAYFYRGSWMRAVYLGDKPIGFVMFGDNAIKYKLITHFKHHLYIWRFMIDSEYQRKGYGSKAMAIIINYVKTRYQAKELITYTLLENRDALEFYKKLGFEPTGKVLPIGDLELRLKL